MFDRIAKDANEKKLLYEQFATFHIKKGIYSISMAQIGVVTMDSIDLWSIYGSKTPDFEEVTKKVVTTSE